MATKDEFIKEWLGMIWCVARTMANTYQLSAEDTEDIVQSVSMKVSKLNPTQRSYGAQFIKTCINNASRDELARILRWRKGVFSYDEPLSTDDEEGSTYADILADHRQNPERDATNKILVETLLSRCSPESQQVIRLNLGFDGKDPISHHEIAKRLNTTVRNVQQLIAEGFEAMKQSTKNTTYRAIETICSVCGERETALVPQGADNPTESHCMACGEITECSTSDLTIETTNICPLTFAVGEVTG